MPARELGPNFVLVTVESDEEQAMHRLPGYPGARASRRTMPE